MKIKTFASFSFGCRVNQAEREELDRKLLSSGFVYNLNNPSLYIINSSKQLLITGDLKFNTSGEDSKPLFGLKIYNLRTKEYINLERYPGSLRDYEKFQNEEGNLVVDDSGWQLNIPFYNK